MTVTAQIPYNTSIAAPGAKVFPYGFKIIEAGDLLVLVNGVKKTLGVDYTVSGVGLDGGGDVTMIVALVGGERVLRKSNMLYQRATDYQHLGDLKSTTLNNDQDAPVLMIRQVAGELAKTLQLPDSQLGVVNPTLPTPLPLQALRYNGAGTGFETYLPGPVSAPEGANQVGFTQAGTGATPRSVEQKLRESVSVKDFGSLGDGVADEGLAFTRTMLYQATRGGGRIHIPTGIYNFGAPIDISGFDNIWFDGDGQDNTILRSTSPTANLFYSNADRKFRKFSNFTCTSSVTKTAGAMFDFLAERRTVITDVKITEHFDGINMRGFEECEINRVRIVKPSGYGRGLAVGTLGVFGAGANLHVTGCFIRGGNDLAATPPVGSVGVAVYDCDALYMFDTDIGGFIDSDMTVNASIRAANFFFTQCYFDATKSSHCILVLGAGTKQQWSFVNCWIASAGKLTGGSNTACGLFLADQGTYASVMFTGCRFYANSGSGVYIGKAGATQFSGCNFELNGAGGGNNQSGLKVDYGAATAPGTVVTGSVFTGNTPKAIQTTGLTREMVISGCSIDNGTAIIEGTLSHASGFDKSSNVYASTGRLAISPFHDFIRVTGTTNIGGMDVTYAGHMVTLKFDGALVVVDASQNLALASNFTTAAGSTLTLRCDGATWWEVGRVNT